MGSIFQLILNFIKGFLFNEAPIPESVSEEHRQFLSSKVSFYAQLVDEDKTHFEQRCVAFIAATEFVGHDIEVTDEDKLLVASGSVILAWGFPHWHYVKVDTIFLVSSSFNENSEFGKKDSNIYGLVGTHHLAGKMILSQPALHHGFSNDNDKRNVAIHEFAHLIDMADGGYDGLPMELSEKAFCLPWLEMVKQGINDIQNKKSDIRRYGATNNMEFFAVISEYFFERPKLFKRKNPELYNALERFYQQNRADVQTAIRVRKKAPCPCGSGKRYKRCCLVKSASIAK